MNPKNYTDTRFFYQTKTIRSIKKKIEAWKYCHINHRKCPVDVKMAIINFCAPDEIPFVTVKE